MIGPQERTIPEKFIVLSAAMAEQINGPIKDNEHGLFTYYALKGLGGVADANKDKKLILLTKLGGAGRNRTDDLYNAIVALSQLSCRFTPPQANACSRPSE